MTSGFFTGDLLRGLAVRVLLFLSLTLLPIGLVSIGQTRQLAEQSRTSAELSLLAVTERVSSAEQSVLQEAFGAAEALASIVVERRTSAKDCSALLQEYKEASDRYTLVGFIASDGKMTCSSIDETADFSESPTFKAILANPGRRATTLANGTLSRRPVTVINTPVFEDEELVGVMAISIPFATFENVEEPDLPIKPLSVVTFNHEGEILTSEKVFSEIATEMPRDVALAALVSDESAVFRTMNERGRERAYAVMPLVPGAAYAISVWPSDTPFLESDLYSLLNSILPVVMWIVSLIVAFWALNRLAITHIRKLGRQMRRFALNRTLPRDTLGPSVPTELVEMERAFIDMAESILRDEAVVEDSLREKNILLKEVHHRVKNNLQLISSIMNMQIRQAQGDDAKFVLRRLQERILSLATVHENLYKDDDLRRVEASTLLRESVNQLLSVGLVPGAKVKVTQRYDTVMLDSDDAAPLTLLTSEAVTNALKYVAASDEDKGRIHVSLTKQGPEMAMLTVENTAKGEPGESGTGLGTKLITAFTRQLNGNVEVERREDLYRLKITFPVPQTVKPVFDY